MLFQIGYNRDFSFFVIHLLNTLQIYFLQTSYNVYEIKFWYCLFEFFFVKHCWNHSRKKRKDSLEVWTELSMFSLELEISGVAVQSIH